MSKVLNLNDCQQYADEQKLAGKKVVLCHGTFDLLHIGHIRHLNAAKAFGDILIVTLTADAFVNKGPGRPVFGENLRAENLAALECVSRVAIVHDATAIPAIQKIKPSIYVKGLEYANPQQDITGNIQKEQEAVEQGGGLIQFTDDIVFSSSSLLNRHFSVFPERVKTFLTKAGQKFDAQIIQEQIKSLASLKVCVVGDAIIDEYVTTEPLGQTGKGNIMAVRHLSSERFAGGSLAVANHIAGFCKNVTLVTGLGTGDVCEKWVCQKLKPSVSPVIFHRDDVPTVVKTRFVDPEINKLFEVYHYDDRPMNPTHEQQLMDWINTHLEGFDIVVVPDFGNGFISRKVCKLLSQKAKFLAINTQVNSGNRGFHSVTRYPRADFISLNEPELRLAQHNRFDPVDELALHISQKLGARFLAVTQGVEGLMLMDSVGQQLIRVPALSFKVVDRIGAGDAFLSLASLCLGGGLDPDVAAFVGSAAAAIDVQIVCNRESVEPVDLYKYMVTLLK